MLLAVSMLDFFDRALCRSASKRIGVLMRSGVRKAAKGRQFLSEYLGERVIELPPLYQDFQGSDHS